MPDHAASIEPQPTLVGERVMLRPWTSMDIDGVFVSCQDPEIQRWTEVPRPYAWEHAQQFVDEVAPKSWAAGEGALFAVVNMTDLQVVGSMSVVRFNQGVAAIGYWTARQSRERGLTTAALRLLTRWCICERGSARVELEIEDTNAPSRRVAVNAGFFLEGTLRQRHVLNGQRIDVVMYSCLASEGSFL
ncbi:MAG: GNAT family protein [Dermatophilaceae bacterium]